LNASLLNKNDPKNSHYLANEFSIVRRDEGTCFTFKGIVFIY